MHLALHVQLRLAQPRTRCAADCRQQWERQTLRLVRLCCAMLRLPWLPASTAAAASSLLDQSAARLLRLLLQPSISKGACAGKDMLSPVLISAAVCKHGIGS